MQAIIPQPIDAIWSVSINATRHFIQSKNLKQAGKSDQFATVLTLMVYAMHTPQVVQYLSSIGSTFSFILTGAKANNIEGSPKLQSTLKDL